MKVFCLSLIAVAMLPIASRAQNALVVEERPVSPFRAIYARGGVNVFVRQGLEERVRVEETERYLSVLKTEVVENVLYIYYDDRLKNTREKRGRVFVSINDLAGVKAGGGADVVGENVFRVARLELIASGGSDIKLAVHADELTAVSSGGADIVLEGEARFFDGQASGGSDISGHALQVRKAKLEAGGGSDIHISVVEELTAEVHGGADISYRGQPEKLYIVEKGGGDVKRRN